MRTLTLVSAVIAAALEVCLLLHPLFHSYPYKMFEAPPAESWQRFAGVAGVVAVVLPVAILVAACRRLPRATPVFAVLAVPISFFGAVSIQAVSWWLTAPANIPRNYDGLCVPDALSHLLRVSLETAILGVAVLLVLPASIRLFARVTDGAA